MRYRINDDVDAQRIRAPAQSKKSSVSIAKRFMTRWRKPVTPRRQRQGLPACARTRTRLLIYTSETPAQAAVNPIIRHALEAIIRDVQGHIDAGVRAETFAPGKTQLRPQGTKPWGPFGRICF